MAFAFRFANGIRRNAYHIKSYSQYTVPSIITTTFVNNIYTVPIHEQEYVNALVVCPATQSKLFVG